jgi:hypothetical protein
MLYAVVLSVVMLNVLALFIHLHAFLYAHPSIHMSHHSTPNFHMSKLKGALWLFIQKTFILMQQIQKGGDIPTSGLRMSLPERPKGKISPKFSVEKFNKSGFWVSIHKTS